MLNDGMIAVIRTAVPAAVGSLLALLAGWGVQISDDAATPLVAGAVALTISVYYAAVTFLERQVNPAFGWLLGKATAPTYTTEPQIPVEWLEPDADLTSQGEDELR